ncbi:MAG: hypothetical protein PHQ12_03095 [Chthoniobacteraceae bacterium]|nr:hypothetical protein [Chthoniobacteraceae bacterium]
MKWRGMLLAGALGMAAGMGTPAAAQAQGFQLKTGCHYAIGFQESMTPGAVAAPSPAAPGGRNVAVYRVLGSAGDQQWYRLRMVSRAPQGGWYTPPGSPEIWVNLTYALWVQEVLR